MERDEMEFLRELKETNLQASDLKEMLTISTLPKYCSSIETVISDKGNEGEIYCLWGLFDIKRETIEHGVWFSLSSCPHDFAWTITHNQKTQEVIVRCTMDKEEDDKDFIESIDQFVTDWESGIKQALA